MRKIAAVVAIMVLVPTTVSAASVPYRLGQYGGGDTTPQNYSHGTKPIVLFTVTQGRVEVTALRFRERCSDGEQVFAAFGSLPRGDRFVGRIQPNGRFVATYPYHGEATLSGTLKGNAGTVKATDRGPLASDHKIICRGSQSFHATLQGPSQPTGR